MSEIRTDDWGEFSSQVAEATSSGSEVQIITGPDASGNFVALVDGGPDGDVAPAGEADSS